MLHPRTELDAYANSWPRDVDTRPGNLGDWPPPRTPPRSGQARHRRRQRGRHRARSGDRNATAELTTGLAADLATDSANEVAAAVAAGAVSETGGDRAAAHTLGPFALPPGGVPPVDAWPAEVMPDEAMPGEVVARETPPETPAEQTRPAGWWRVPGDAEPRHPRARPPAARAGVEATPVAERDRRPWLAGTALFVAVAIAGSWVVSSRQHSSDELPPPDTTAYGATGRLPDTHTARGDGGAPRAGGGLSRAGGEATLAATTGAPGVAAVGDPRIPEAMTRAYRSAEARLDATAPGCGLSWSPLAGIGKVESDHARGGNIDAEGTTLSPIVGPALDGTSGNADIPDTDNGALDGDTRWDRAVGPSQFIPTSWDIYGADGNDDGRTDPHNAYDAATATGRYLCAGGLDLSDPADLNTAVFRYNHSQDYVDTVLGWARTYGAPGAAAAAAAPPAAAPKPATVIPVPPRASPPPRARAAAPTTSVPAAREPRRPASSPAASSSAPVPRSRVPRHQAPRPARPHATPSRPTRSAATPVRPAPAPATTSPMLTDQAPTRRPVPRTTPAPTTTTTTPPPTTTPASPPGSPSTDPRSPGCLLQATTPTSTPAPTSGSPDLPGSALLGDLAGSITLLGDCCNDW